MTKTKYAVDAATKRIRFKRKLKLNLWCWMFMSLAVGFPRVSDYMQYSVFTVGLVGNDI